MKIFKRTNTFSPLCIYIANNCLVTLTCILANNFANNFVAKLNNRAFSSKRSFSTEGKGNESIKINTTPVKTKSKTHRI